MSNTIFRFKQFFIEQDKCAMKLNTDGVLLGAWADATDAKSVLDIGTGTGVIALMLAQRNSQASIDAIDIDQASCIQVRENFDASPWSDRLNVIHCALQDFEPHKKYDFIISNPPYFIDDSKTGDQRKDMAKHSISLTYKDLITGIDRLLSDSGKAFLVLPIFNFDLLKLQLSSLNLFVTALAEVAAVEGKSSYLVLIKLERSESQLKKSNIIIQNSHENFTDQYKSLTKDFYLKF